MYFINFDFSLNIDFIKKQDREIQKSKFREERIDNWSSEYSN